MDFEALVRAISERVLAELKARGAAAPAGPLVLVLAEREMGLESRVKKLVGQEAHIIFSGEGGGERIGAAAKRYILPFLTAPAMAALALGQAHCPRMHETLKLLLAGRKVEVLDFEYQAFAHSAPARLFDLYENYAKSLAAYGLVKFEEPAPEALRLREALVTADGVYKAAAAGARSLLVPATAKITPLAADAARELGLDIIKSL